MFGPSYSAKASFKDAQSCLRPKSLTRTELDESVDSVCSERVGMSHRLPYKT